MRVLFCVSGWPTHYLTMVPLGWALQAAGHEVRVLCMASQVGPICQAGMVPVPLLDGIPVEVHNRLGYHAQARRGTWPYPWLPLHPLTGVPMAGLDDFDVDRYRAEVEPDLLAAEARGYDEAVRFARNWRPHVVLYDPMALAGLLAARVLKVPAALVLWGPVGTHETEFVGIVPPDRSGSFARYGLGEFDLRMIEWVVDPVPEPLTPPVAGRRTPLRYVPYNGPAAVQDWMLDRPRRRRVCVVWSTALSTMSGPGSYLLPMVLDGLAMLDVEVVLTGTARDVGALCAVSDSVRVLRRAPLHLLLDRCDAVVHHGGAGSTMTALMAGTPQLALTCAPEQAANGDRLAATGAGRHLPAYRATVARVAEEIGALLDQPGHHACAAQLRERGLARPSPARFAQSLEQFATR